MPAYRAYRDLPADWTNDQAGPYLAEVYRLADIIKATPALTPQGMAVKLRYVLMAQHQGAAATAAVMDGAPMPENELVERSDRRLWQLIQDADRLGAARTAAGVAAVRAHDEDRKRGGRSQSGQKSSSTTSAKVKGHSAENVSGGKPVLRAALISATR